MPVQILQYSGKLAVVREIRDFSGFILHPSLKYCTISRAIRSIVDLNITAQQCVSYFWSPWNISVKYFCITSDFLSEWCFCCPCIFIHMIPFSVFQRFSNIYVWGITAKITDSKSPNFFVAYISCLKIYDWVFMSEIT